MAAVTNSPVLSTGGASSVRARRTLPGARAIAGAALITLAALGTYLSYQHASSSAWQTAVVASHDLVAGTSLRAGDLTTTRIQMIDSKDLSNIYSKPDVLVGTVITSPLSSGEIVQPSSVVKRISDPKTVEVAVSLDDASALGGTLRQGERVDVVTTSNGNTSLDAANSTLATDAVVVLIKKSSSNLSVNQNSTVLLAVESRDAAKQIAQFANDGKVALVRTTGANLE